MKTNDIMESLKMESIWRSNQPIPSHLLNEIEEGLNQRDKAIELLRAILKQHGDSSTSMMNADRWLFDNVEDYT